MSLFFKYRLQAFLLLLALKYLLCYFSILFLLYTELNEHNRYLNKVASLEFKKVSFMKKIKF
jgi:hypothetical protein